MKKLKKKIMIGLGVFIFILISGIGPVAYLGIQAAGVLIAHAPTQQQTEALTRKIIEKSQVTVVGITSINCWSTLQSHFVISKWLVQPISENITNIIAACLIPRTQETLQSESEAKE